MPIPQDGIIFFVEQRIGHQIFRHLLTFPDNRFIILNIYESLVVNLKSINILSNCNGSE
jgi:hypothetical protein